VHDLLLRAAFLPSIIGSFCQQLTEKAVVLWLVICDCSTRTSEYWRRWE